MIFLDLFQRIIFQSGSALGPWLLDEKPVQAARGIAESGNCSRETIQEEIDCLKKLSYVDVLKAHSRMQVTFKIQNLILPQP